MEHGAPSSSSTEEGSGTPSTPSVFLLGTLSLNFPDSRRQSTKTKRKRPQDSSLLNHYTNLRGACVCLGAWTESILNKCSSSLPEVDGIHLTQSERLVSGSSVPGGLRPCRGSTLRLPGRTPKSSSSESPRNPRDVEESKRGETETTERTGRNRQEERQSR